LGIEGMLFTRLVHDTQLAEMVTVFDGRAAVFHQRAPAPNNAKWHDSQKQYPRVDFTVDMQEEPARNSSGTLTVNVWCSTKFGQMPESIEARIRALLHATFAQPEDGPPYCFVWARSDPFEVTTETQSAEEMPSVIGCTLAFDIMAFPSQLTIYPDPIQAMNAWTKKILPQAVVIGVDTIDGWLEPTKERPIIYWRITAQAPQKRTFVCVWFNTTIEGHVFAHGADERLYTLRKINTAAAMEHHITMEDSSPMFILRFGINPNMNYLATGQIQAETQFGVLREQYANPPSGPKLVHVNLPREQIESETKTANVQSNGTGHVFPYTAAGTSRTGQTETG
jgi:hypothetical protein